MMRFLSIFEGDIDAARRSYEDAAEKAILKQSGIFSYQAENGEVQVKFSAVECMHHWEIRVPLAELLNYLLKDCEIDSLLVCSEIGDDIAQAMKAHMVSKGGKKRNIYTLKEEFSIPVVRSEDNRRITPSTHMILVENSLERIIKVLGIDNNPLGIREIVHIFGAYQEYNQLCNLAKKRDICVRRAMPLETLVQEYLKNFC